ncbi:MAG: phosphotransferase family protein [Anaerolineae bacterium]
MPTSKIEVPQDISEVTAEWLAVALGSLIQGKTVDSIRTTQIGEEFGFASKIYRVSWNRLGQVESVVIKLWDLTKAGDREVLFYQTFSECGTRIPKYYFSKIDYKTGRGILILEDLTDVVQGDVLKRLDLHQGVELAKSLARLHSKWANNPKLVELDWVAKHLAWFRTYEWFKSRYELYLSRFPDHLDGLPRLLLDNLHNAPTVANERLRNSSSTLLHGDFHLDNIVFEQGDKPIILDWSRPMNGPAVINLAALLFEMIDLNNFDHTLEAYCAEFNQLSETPLQKDELESELGGALLVRFEVATYGIAKWEPELPRAIKIIDDGIRHAAEAIEFWHKREPELFSFLFDET